MRYGMAMLATIGATSPFVGLFGTVWGIMNSFIGISKAQTTNLAVVAPGIAEALAGDRHRPRRRDPGGDHLQSFFARDQRLSRICRPRLRRGRPPVVARSRPRRAAGCWRGRRSRAMAAVLGDLDDDDDDFDEAHDINVTPFIDVMLVLLIIFMIAAPLSTVDLPVDLPSSTAVPQKKPDKPTYVTIKSDLAVAIGETPVKRVDLVRTLDAMAGEGKDRRIFLRADRGVPYGELMDVLERLRVGGYGHIALVALEGVPDDRRAGRPPARLL